jgi:ArsR family transcriptional regulator, arsenate/arsenite/antimonite-responsive transcriptional repressor
MSSKKEAVHRLFYFLYYVEMIKRMNAKQNQNIAHKLTNSEEVSLHDVLESFRASLPIFNALGDSFRQDIVMLLAQQERLNVTQIAQQMPLSRPAVSHHLKVLLLAGLVNMERVSRENFYSLAVDDALAILRRFVEQAEVSCT